MEGTKRGAARSSADDRLRRLGSGLLGLVGVNASVKKKNDTPVRPTRPPQVGRRAPDDGYRRVQGDDSLSPSVVVGLLRVGDAVVVLLAAMAAYMTRFPDFSQFGTLELWGVMLAVLLTTNILQLAGLYSFPQLTYLFGQSGRLLLAWAAVMLSLLALGFMTKAPLVSTSRLWVGLWFVYGFFGLFTLRLVVKHQVQRWQRCGRLTRNVAVVGAGEHGQRLIEHLQRHGESAQNVIGIFDDRRGRVPEYIGGLPVLGTIDDLLAFARRHPIDVVIVALPWDAESRLLAWMKKLRSLPADVRLCPDMIGFHLPHRQVTHIGGVPMLNVFDKPLAGWNLIVKSLEDRVLAACILTLIMPFLALISLAIKLDSRGPVLFRQQRYGFNNEVIEISKFRTMHVDRCDDSDVVQATRDDPRVTRVGRILRRTSLDELPQFLNVLGGTMSIVGPRPHAVAHNEQYSRLIDEYLARHRVKPGITGWAQVNGLRGETETLEKMEQRVRYDLYYIENWSLLFDVRIILRTLLVGFRHPNAY
jgi:Undecaprenyl-phosphate glucose phosphotransferase